MAEGHRNGHNLLLQALAGDDVTKMMPSLELISLGLRHILYEPDTPIEYVYFPVDGVHSMLAQIEDGLEVEVGTVGTKGWWGCRCSWAATALREGRFRRCRGGRTGFRRRSSRS